MWLRMDGPKFGPPIPRFPVIWKVPIHVLLTVSVSNKTTDFPSYRLIGNGTPLVHSFQVLTLKSFSCKQTRRGVELKCRDAEKETNPSAPQIDNFGQEESYLLLHRIRARGHCRVGSYRGGEPEFVYRVSCTKRSPVIYSSNLDSKLLSYLSSCTPVARAFSCPSR